MPSENGQYSDVWERSEPKFYKQTDPKYKRYANSIERALALFDSVEEWADYISFLGKLLKALQSHKAQYVPYSLEVSSRLAESLQPSLPSGVHQKALEVYGYIFGSILGENLGPSLHIWLPGLLPLMNYASINVKPHLLHILDSYIITVPSTYIQAALKPLLMSLFPGIEDESSESFEASLDVVDKLRQKVNDDSLFWQCFCLIVISSNERRPGALVYASRYLPNISDIPLGESKEALMKTLDEPVRSLVSPEPGLLVRAISKGLQDEQNLVQRGFLELLVKNLRLSSGVLQQIVSPPDLVMLVKSAVLVVLRKDMSLNRRLWAWLLGPDPSPDNPIPVNRIQYFSQYGKSPLLSALEEQMDLDSDDSSQKAVPYRICLSLLDRWELGESVATSLFVPLMENVQKFGSLKSSENDFKEVLKAARSLFDGVEAVTIWGKILMLIKEDPAHGIDFLLFMLDFFDVREEEMVVIHMPLILLYLFKIKLDENKISTKSWFKACSLLFKSIPSRALLFDTSTSTAGDTNIDPMINEVDRFYTDFDREKAPALPFSVAQLSGVLLSSLTDIVSASLRHKSADVYWETELLKELYVKIPAITPSSGQRRPLYNEITLLMESKTLPFEFLQGINSVVCLELEHHNIPTTNVDDLVFKLVTFLWKFLSNPVSRYHVDAVHCLLNLQDILKGRKIEAFISTLLVKPDSGLDAGKGVMHLWNLINSSQQAEAILSRPIFLLLDSLYNPDSNMSVLVRTWLSYICQNASAGRLFTLLLNPLLNNAFASLTESQLSEEDDLQIIIYHLKTLNNVFESGPKSLLIAFSKSLVVSEHISTKAGDLVAEGNTYQDVLIKFLVSLLNFRAPNILESDLVSDYSLLMRSALRILQFLLSHSTISALDEETIYRCLLPKLSESLTSKDEVVQMSILPVALLGFQRNSSALMGDLLGSLETMRDSNEISSNNPDFIRLLVSGLTQSSNSTSLLECWIEFFLQCLPLLSNVVFQVLIHLVECLCKQTVLSFDALKDDYDISGLDERQLHGSVSTFFCYASGLEGLVKFAHAKLNDDQGTNQHRKSSSEPGFFGTVISGVFSVESPLLKNAAINNRLTVLLCYQDVVRSCYAIWDWGDSAVNDFPDSRDDLCKFSLSWTASRLKERAWRVLEYMYRSESLETLETIMVLSSSFDISRVMKFTRLLDNGHPSTTVTDILSSIFSRVNPSIISEPRERSSLTNDLPVKTAVEFLISYIDSVDDEILDDIWPIGIMLLRDACTNTAPYKSVLPSILRFGFLMGAKSDPATYGPQRKVRKELNELLVKCLYLTLSRTMGNSTLLSTSDTSMISRSAEKLQAEVRNSIDDDSLGDGGPLVATGSENSMVAVLLSIIPDLSKVLQDPDRILTASVNITNAFALPALKSKNFPLSFTKDVLEILTQLSSQPYSGKAWRGLVNEVYSDARFFTMPSSEAPLWGGLIATWVDSDEDKFSEILSRITTSTSNTNALFGWSEQEAQARILNIKRICFMMLACEVDKFATSIQDVISKISELLKNSTSARIRSYVYLLIRSVVLRCSAINLKGIWTVIWIELYTTFTKLCEMNHDEANEHILSIYHACKLIDTLLVIDPEEFQLKEWLFVTETADAVFHTRKAQTLALVDFLANNSKLFGNLVNTDMGAIHNTPARAPILLGSKRSDISELTVFFSHLSLHTYEARYSLEKADIKECQSELINDLFAIE